MSKKKPSRRGRKKTVPTERSEPIVAPRLADVHIVVQAAAEAGWKGRDGFHAALLLLANGASASEAVALFRDAAARVQ
jgi:hypothetical protein